MKTSLTIVSTSLVLFGLSRADVFDAVTNAWWQGRVSNVVEIAQTRLAIDTNDIPALVILTEVDMDAMNFVGYSNHARSHGATEADIEALIDEADDERGLPFAWEMSTRIQFGFTPCKGFPLDGVVRAALDEYIWEFYRFSPIKPIKVEGEIEL